MDEEEKKANIQATLELREKAFLAVGRAWPKQEATQGTCQRELQIIYSCDAACGYRHGAGFMFRLQVHTLACLCPHNCVV